MKFQYVAVSKVHYARSLCCNFQFLCLVKKKEIAILVSRVLDKLIMHGPPVLNSYITKGSSGLNQHSGSAPSQ
jgi:hypothetical protein